MTENTFKAGDVVRLKSGGPTMTVTRVGEGAWVGTVWVSWFDSSNKPQSGEYPQEALELVD
ncbi:DUF2158 domain-containing protein [Sphingobium sp. WCS2017Hpa-17]|uniref:YodC family protein n=1 Tax=Sphingobium sp. WCS2017Hpa-17 TaxID=3073638 RepID=UPI00288C19CE|nr:DUF2158 domain-containing protein [Sphingobium sp. WCS2017Hpa-17]